MFEPPPRKSSPRSDVKLALKQATKYNHIYHSYSKHNWVKELPLTLMMTTTHPSLHNTEHLTHPKYRADIDGLRAIAILSVVGFHAFPNWIKGGFIGVDVFFVISGYLISTIIIGSLERDSFSFVEFYSRRIKRIFPALLLVLVASFAFGWFVLLADEYKQWTSPASVDT